MNIKEEQLRQDFEEYVMSHIIISKKTLEGLWDGSTYRNTTLSGRDYAGMWEKYKAERNIAPVAWRVPIGDDALLTDDEAYANRISKETGLPVQPLYLLSDPRISLPDSDPVIPDGWHLVPEDPTWRMFKAYEENSIAPMGKLSSRGYKAALEAAPAYEAGR